MDTQIIQNGAILSKDTRGQVYSFFTAIELATTIVWLSKKERYQVLKLRDSGKYTKLEIDVNKMTMIEKRLTNEEIVG